MARAAYHGAVLLYRRGDAPEWHALATRASVIWSAVGRGVGAVAVRLVHCVARCGNAVSAEARMIVYMASIACMGFVLRRAMKKKRESDASRMCVSVDTAEMIRTATAVSCHVFMGAA